MSKAAVLSVDIASMLSPINFKKQILLFDKIYIDFESLSVSRNLARNEGYDSNKIKEYENNEREIFYLRSIGLIEMPNFPYAPVPKSENDEIYPMTGSKQSPYVFDIISSQIMRSKLLATKLQGEDIEAYPLYQAERKRNFSGGKDQVIQFVLSNIPEPDDSISWEQIIDFRNDEDTLRKYYALIKWINDVSKKQAPLNEVIEEYNYLYHDYLAQYRLHKMKLKQGIVEVIVSAAIDVLAGTLSAGSLNTSLFSAFKLNVDLLEEELKFTGREIAYIHKAERTFNCN